MIVKAVNADLGTQVADSLDIAMEELDRLNQVVSNLTSLDIAMSGTTVYGAGGTIYNAPGPTLLGQIQHGLGYVPAFRAWMKVDGGGGFGQSFPMSYTSVYTGSGPNGKVAFQLQVVADSQYLNFYLNFGFPSSVGAPVNGWMMRYYIFRSPIS